MQSLSLERDTLANRSCRILLVPRLSVRRGPNRELMEQKCVNTWCNFVHKKIGVLRG